MKEVDIADLWTIESLSELGNRKKEIRELVEDFWEEPGSR